MGLRILENKDDSIAVLYCSTSEIAFGPLIRDFESEDGPEAFASEMAEAFLHWLKTSYPDDPLAQDPRLMPVHDLVTEYGNFMQEMDLKWQRILAEVREGPEPDGIRVEAGRSVPTSR